LQQSSIFALLTNFVIFSASIFYALAVLAVLVLRRKHPEWPRPYRTWGYPLVPLAFVAGYCWFLWRVYLDKPFEAQAGLLLIALGLPVYAAWRAWAARTSIPAHLDVQVINR
jgi:APA family basic amino acid/polyamine antiporter